MVHVALDAKRSQLPPLSHELGLLGHHAVAGQLQKIEEGTGADQQLAQSVEFSLRVQGASFFQDFFTEFSREATSAIITLRMKVAVVQLMTEDPNVLKRIKDNGSHHYDGQTISNLVQNAFSDPQSYSAEMAEFYRVLNV